MNANLHLLLYYKWPKSDVRVVTHSGTALPCQPCDMKPLATPGKSWAWCEPVQTRQTHRLRRKFTMPLGAQQHHWWQWILAGSRMGVLGAMINKTSVQWLISQRLTIHMDWPRLTHSLKSSHPEAPPSKQSAVTTLPVTLSGPQYLSPSVQWEEMLHDPHLALQWWQRNWLTDTLNISRHPHQTREHRGMMTHRKSFAGGYDVSPKSSICTRNWHLIKVYWEVSKPWLPVNSPLTALLTPTKRESDDRLVAKYSTWSG